MAAQDYGAEAGRFARTNRSQKAPRTEPAPFWKQTTTICEPAHICAAWDLLELTLLGISGAQLTDAAGTRHFEPGGALAPSANNGVRKMIELKIATLVFGVGALISLLTTNVGHELVSVLLAGLFA